MIKAMLLYEATAWCQMRETLVLLDPFAGVIENLPDKDSACFNKIVCMHASPALPQQNLQQKAGVMKQKHLDMETYFGLKLPRGLVLSKKRKEVVEEGKMRWQLSSYSHI